MNDYIFVSDGAFSSSRQQMGVGLIIINSTTNKRVLTYSKMYKGGTNNIAEIAAVLIGLRLIRNSIKSLTIYTDSMYVIGCASLGWSRKKNVRLWQEFDKEFARVKKLCNNITFEHVNGHQSGDNLTEIAKLNNEADKLAVRASQEYAD